MVTAALIFRRNRELYRCLALGQVDFLLATALKEDVGPPGAGVFLRHDQPDRRHRDPPPSPIDPSASVNINRFTPARGNLEYGDWMMDRVRLFAAEHLDAWQ